MTLDKLTPSQVRVLDQIAMTGSFLARDWRTHRSLISRGLIEHNEATWKYPEPYFHLTDNGREVWSDIVTRKIDEAKR